jgi:hypothetical protein
LLASIPLPGLGLLLYGHQKEGLLILVAWLLFFPVFLLTARDLIGLVFVPFLAYLWAIGMMGAWRGVRR